MNRLVNTSLFFLKILSILFIISILIIGYIFYYYSRDLPDYSQLAKYYPPSTTRIYSADGKLMEEYAREHRIFVPISNIPDTLIQAFVAAEDKNFYTHVGIDVFSIIRAAIANVMHLVHKGRVEGGSTITQQVVKNFLLTSDRSLERKVKEAILSYMVTKVFTKEQIMELYLNQMYLGKGAHGVASAALAYFNKSVEELTLNESAVLAAMPKAPSSFNPERNYDRAFKRKNYVLGRMYDDGYITEEQAREAIKEPIILKAHDKVQFIDAGYYAEQVRQEVINMFGEEYFYTAGLTIITSLDSTMQTNIADALHQGIIRFDRKKGYRKPYVHIDNTDDWQERLNKIANPVGLKNDKMAIILEVNDTTAIIGLKNGEKGHIKLAETAWARTNLKSLKTIMTVGDVIFVSHAKEDHYKLSQIPEVNGAAMAMNPKNGRVYAQEGGYDYDANKFNRAIQAQRQPGSLIKPIVYAAALENGAHPNDIYIDQPIELEQGPGLPLWKPKNWDSKFVGPMTMRQGIEKSRNIVTIKIGLSVGLNKIIETVKRFGLNDNPAKVNSILLGSVESTLEKVVSAFAVFVNHGYKVTPHYIEMIKDRKGNIIYRREYNECSECEKALVINDQGEILPPTLPEFDRQIITDSATAYQILSFMRGVVERGTANAVKNLGPVIAGKTGTTNDGVDLWYVGMTSDIIVGTYLGYDTPRSLGQKAYGATYSLPIFIDFMSKTYKDKPAIPFEVPDSIRLISVDYNTGKPFVGDGSILEAFKKNDYHPILDEPHQNNNNNLDPFEKIQKKDNSSEVY